MTMKIKPLDGAPFMSDNCWQAVLDAVRDRAKQKQSVRILEWGSGNSTIHLARLGGEIGTPFKITSVEHETRFFGHLAESVLAACAEKGTCEAVWQPLRGFSIPVSHIGNVSRDRRDLRGDSLTWQIMLGNKHFQYIDGFKPYFGFSPLKIIKNLVKLGLLELSYRIWLGAGLARSLGREQKDRLGNIAWRGGEAQQNFLDYFQNNPAAGRLRIACGNMDIYLWHLPGLRPPMMKDEIILDGPITQLQDYVMIPVDSQFDVIFIDGRARISCIKRVHRDTMLDTNGWLFVHDAFRSEMSEAFRLFGPAATFLNGSNVMINGKHRADERFGPPFIKAGNALDAARWEIAQELFVYKRHEHTDS